MEAGKRTWIVAACAAAAVAMPAAASAKVVTYGGKIKPSEEGVIALDVKTGKKGKPKKIVALRGQKVPVECEESDTPTISVNLNRDNTVNPDGSPFAIKVRKNGRFGFSYTDPEYGYERAIKGRFGGKRYKRAGGTFTFGAHYLEDGELPEETCQTDVLDFGAKRGGEDVVFPVFAARR